MALEKMKFYLVKPQAATNYVTNPTPYLATTGYTASVGTIALTDFASRRGPGCIEVTPTIALSGIYFGTVAVVNTQHYTFSVDVKGETGKAMRIRVEDAGGTYTYETVFTATGNWQRVSVTFTAQETASDYRLYVLRDATTGTAVFYVDGFQYEDNKETTFFSGDTQGFDTGRLEFGWNGTPHASTSYRTVNTTAGGVLIDLDDHSKLSGIFGLGAGTYTQLLTDLISGGSYYQGNIRKSRIFSLLLHYTGSLAEIQADRKAVLDLVKPTGQEMVVRYQGFSGIKGDGDEATEPLDIVCVPQPSHGDPGQRPAQQEALLNFTIPSGLLDGAYKEGKELGTSEIVADTNYLAVRNANGQWTSIGVVGFGAIFNLDMSLSGDLYVAGAFLSIDSVANTEKIAYYDGVNWNSISNPAPNNSVMRVAVALNGDVYAVGLFTEIGGVAALGVSRWDGATWHPLGSGLNGHGRTVMVASNGDIYVGGDFTAAGGVADTSRIARWDGTSWNALGTGLDNGQCFAVAEGPSGDIFVGGSFTAAGGAVANTNRIARWDGSNWHALDTGLNGDVYDIKVSSDGTLYAVGAFTTASGNTVNKIAKWNGVQWTALGTGLTGGFASRLFIDNNGDVYVSGTFTVASGLTLSDSLAVWRKGAWNRVEITFPTSAAMQGIFIDKNRNFYLSGDFTGPAVSSNINLIINLYNTTFPIVRIVGPGLVQSLANYTNDKQIQFDGLTLQAGETLTMRLEPTRLSITSNFRGNCMRYVIPGSDSGSFILQEGENSIGLFMPSGTTADTKAYIEYTPRFDGIEGALHE